MNASVRNSRLLLRTALTAYRWRCWWTDLKISNSRRSPPSSPPPYQPSSHTTMLNFVIFDCRNNFAAFPPKGEQQTFPAPVSASARFWSPLSSFCGQSMWSGREINWHQSDRIIFAASPSKDWRDHQSNREIDFPLNLPFPFTSSLHSKRHPYIPIPITTSSHTITTYTHTRSHTRLGRIYYLNDR